jgi:hypothetical protein
MPQIVGNPSAGITGIQIGLGADGVGQVVWLIGTGAPSGQTDPSVVNAAVGSLYTRLDGGSSTTLYVKEGASTWTAK